MIDHLHIKNFLAFPELVVPELKLINLVAGKNNAGKTAMLEALWINQSTNKFAAIKAISKKRKGRIQHQYEKNNGEAKTGQKAESVLFEIGEYKIAFSEKTGTKIDWVQDGKVVTHIVEVDNPFQLIEPDNLLIESRSDYRIISKIWINISLTEDEDFVLDILNKVFDRTISRLAINEDYILVREDNQKEPYNIESLGEGAKRLLLLAIALVVSKGKILLIDEIETHLHHSVIRKLWKIIFEYATKWNIQVVATTHSQDAIREFWYEAAEKDEYRNTSQVLRLQLSREGKHEVIQFPFDLLDSVMEMEMEIR